MLNNIKSILLKDTKIQVVGIQFGKVTSYYILNISNNQLNYFHPQQ